MTLPEVVAVMARDVTEAEWISDALRSLKSDGISEVRVLAPDELSRKQSLSGMDLFILDSSIGLRKTMETLQLAGGNGNQIAIILCLKDFEREEYSDTIRFGVQDFILKGQDSTEVIKRVLAHSIQRVQILQATAEAEARVRTIIDNISDGVLIVDDAKTILFANPASEEILGRQLLDLMGAPLGLSIPGEANAVVELQLEGNETKVLSVKWVPIRWEGRDVRLYMMRNITEQNALQEKLIQATENAERFEALKSSFMANMSHELRLPLASIIGFGQLIEADVKEPELKEFSATIVESGNKLLETINSVLDLTRLDASSFEMRRIPLSIQQAVEDVVSDLAPLLDNKMLPVHVTALGDDEIKADPIVLQRIFNNVIGNAIKFTDQGEITVSISATPDSVLCEVSDTGIGIGSAFIPHVFDEYAQESSGATRSYNGAGLGLAITKKLLGAMGGSITVRSTKGSGSTFSLQFPKHATSSTS